jgi:CRP-like cAMP-binding protein
MSQSEHILADCWLTANLTIEEAEALLTRCSLRVLQAGEQLFEAGKASHDLWFVRSGAIELTADGVTTTKPVRVQHPATLCDMSLLSPGPHSVTATAVEPTRLYGLSHEAFLALKHEAPNCTAKLLRAIAPALAARLRSCNDRTDSATMERQLNLAAPGTTLGGAGGGHLQAMADQLIAEGSRAPSTTRMPSQSQEARGSDRARPVTQKQEAEPEKPGIFGRFKQAIVGKPDPKGNG